MANGYAPFLLQHLKQLVADNYPGTKVTPTGFLKMLLQNNPSLQIPDYEKIRLNNSAGHIKTVRLHYYPRILPSEIAAEKTCDNNFIPVRKELNLEAIKERAISFYISNEEIAKYLEDASKTVSAGLPATPFMNEHLDVLMHTVNGIVGAINIDLLGLVTWGNNAVTGTNTAVSVNLNASTTNNSLTDGFTKIFDDAMQNEFSGNLLITGSGLMNNFQIQKGYSAATAAGIDASRIAGYEWYYDLYTASAWGANQIGVFSKGSVGFVDLNKYIGFRSGRLANSTFFQLQLPVMPLQNDGAADLMTFDVQLKEIDCPTEIFNGYENVTVKEGYQFIVSKNFGLFQVPADAYQSGDRLEGNNGALRYTITNNCVECAAEEEEEE